MDEKSIQFDYVAVSHSGEKKKGTITASSNDRAYQMLIVQGLAPLRVVKKSDSIMQREIVIPGFEKKAKLKALAVFTKQFALLIRSGMPMLESLNISASQTEDVVLKKALEEVANDVEGGAPLSASMEKHPLAFPGLLSSVVAVGEEGGFLDQALDSMSKTYSSELKLLRKLRAALTYPVIVVVASLLILTGMLIWVVPIFGEMFEGMGAELPVMTQTLIMISNNMLILIPSAVVLGFVAVYFYRKYIQEEWFLLKVDRIKLTIPVFGKLNTKIAISRFSRNLAMMISAGVALIPALKLVSSTANNAIISRSIANAVKHMENGGSLSASIKNFEMFPLMVTQMIVVGEKSGSLASMLDTVADFYDDEVEELSDSLAVSLEPLMLIILGGLVGSMLFALYIPMLSMFELISEG